MEPKGKTVDIAPQEMTPVPFFQRQEVQTAVLVGLGVSLLANFILVLVVIFAK